MKILALIFVLTLPLLTPRVAASDEIEYFSYLRSIVFDGDLNFLDEYQHYCNLDYDDCVKSRFAETFILFKTPTGMQINFAPIGSALLWSPFYLAAHLVALALGSADGYSPPYLYAISFASLLYGWLGIALSYQLAREYVSEKIAWGAALVILFATNALYYLYVAPAMSHANSLMASALFVYVWHRTRESRAQGKLTPWAWLGASGALMTMVREQEAIFVLIPLVESAVLFLTTARAGLKIPRGSTEKNDLSPVGSSTAPRSIRRNLIFGLGTMFAAWLVVFTPQLVVYQVLNGNWQPARDVTQKFTWDGTHIGDVLFSSLHGLFSWTPITLFAVLGLFIWLWRTAPDFVRARDRATLKVASAIVPAAFVITFLAEVYLLGSFSTWFGGAAFGMRRFVNCTVLFVVGLAMLVNEIKTRLPLRVLAPVAMLFVVWNLFFIVQFATGMIPRAEPIDFVKLTFDQIFTVPARLADIAWRFITARTSFYRN